MKKLNKNNHITNQSNKSNYYAPKIYEDNETNEKTYNTLNNQIQYNLTQYNENTNSYYNEHTNSYYNETLNYLQSNSYNKYDENYYNVLNKIGNISRYILKGNDYNKLYISKNSNKYFNNQI